jgi:hypothetical protein
LLCSAAAAAAAAADGYFALQVLTANNKEERFL